MMTLLLRPLRRWWALRKFRELKAAYRVNLKAWAAATARRDHIESRRLDVAARKIIDEQWRLAKVIGHPRPLVDEECVTDARARTTA